jgi:hypothetical protein
MLFLGSGRARARIHRRRAVGAHWRVRRERRGAGPQPDRGSLG